MQKRGEKMEIITEFISTYGPGILYAVLGTIATFIGTKIKKIYERYINDKIKQDVVKTCVKAVEQLYKDLHGEDKYNKAVESISEILATKNINITELEIKMLIEAVCNDFTKSLGDDKNE